MDFDEPESENDTRTPEARRLSEARAARGFKDAKTAAQYFGWNYSTYSQHERGERGLRRDVAKKYATAFKVSLAWLATGDGALQVPVVGYVGAGSHYYPYEGHVELDYVNAPDGSTRDTVAVEIKGDSLGPAFHGWRVFYDEIRRPVTDDMFNRLCVVGLTDGRILVKTVHPGQLVGRYNLMSNDPPIYDAAVEWCARVTFLGQP